MNYSINSIVILIMLAKQRISIKINDVFMVTRVILKYDNNTIRITKRAFRCGITHNLYFSRDDIRYNCVSLHVDRRFYITSAIIRLYLIFLSRVVHSATWILGNIHGWYLHQNSPRTSKD